MPLDLNTYHRPGSESLSELQAFIRTQDKIAVIAAISGRRDGDNTVVFYNSLESVSGDLVFQTATESPSLPTDGNQLICAGAVYIDSELQFLTISRSSS